jgi:hypothetical protein
MHLSAISPLLNHARGGAQRLPRIAFPTHPFYLLRADYLSGISQLELEALSL